MMILRVNIVLKRLARNIKRYVDVKRAKGSPIINFRPRNGAQ